MPGTPSLVFLVYLLALLPWGAMRSARRVGPALGRSGPGSARDRLAIWGSTLFAQGILLFLAWFAGSGFGFRFFVLPARPIDLLAAAAALGACFALRAVARALHSEQERRALIVYRLAPKSSGEWLAWGLIALVASVTEEIAYRGVGVAILGHWTGSAAAAIAVCAAAFAVAHALQGWKSGVVIFAIALVMHALVQGTGSLVPAMVVHFVYDVVAAILIARQARRDGLDTAPPAGGAPLSPGVPA